MEERSYIIIETSSSKFEKTSEVLEGLKERGIVLHMQREKHLPMYPSVSRYWLECVGGTTYFDIRDICKSEGIGLLD